MKTIVEDVDKFGAACGFEKADKPGFPDYKARKLWAELLREEYHEFLDANEVNDLPEVADALVDMVYIIVGLARVHGIPLDMVWAEVQRSNMAKIGSDGLVDRREDGKIMKPRGWLPPQIVSVLRESGWDEEKASL